MKLDDDMLLNIGEPRGELENKVHSEFHMEQFKDGLMEQDKQILQMWYEGDLLKEIVAKVGFKSPSAVSITSRKMQELMNIWYIPRQWIS